MSLKNFTNVSRLLQNSFQYFSESLCDSFVIGGSRLQQVLIRRRLPMKIVADSLIKLRRGRFFFRID